MIGQGGYGLSESVLSVMTYRVATPWNGGAMKPIRRGLAAAIVFLLLGALAAGWHIIRRPLSIERLVGPPASPLTGQEGRGQGANPGQSAAGTGTHAGGGPVQPGAASAPGGRPLPPAVPDRAVVAPRVDPAPAQVREMKREISERVDLPPGVRPTQRQVEGVSEEICKAFDQGYSYGQVVEGLKKAGSRYAVSVSASDAQYAIEAATGTRCPAHSMKLGSPS